MSSASMIHVVENTRDELLAVLAALAMDELTPAQLARVEERYQLVADGPLPAAAWLAARYTPAPVPVPVPARRPEPSAGMGA